MRRYRTALSRIVVLGGTWFLGPHIVRGLAERGHEVCIFHRGKTEPELRGSVHHVHGDFVEFGKHVDALRRFKPDIVVDVVPYMAKDGHGVRHFAGSIDRAVVISSCDVYRAFARLHGSEPGPRVEGPLDETSPTRSRPAPDLTDEIDFDNLVVEAAVCNQSDLPTTVLRLPMIYGPHDPLHRLHRYVKRMDDARPAVLLDERLARLRFSRAFVADVAAAVVIAAERGNPVVYNVGPRETLSEEEWVRAIARLHGWSGRIIVAPSDQVPDVLRARFAVDQDLIIDSSRIRSELAYSEPFDFEAGLRETIEWERLNPPAAARPEAFDYTAEDAALRRLS